MAKEPIMPSAKSAPRCKGNFVDPAKVARVRRALPPEEVIRRVADAFQVLGDPTRLRILHALAAAELCVCDLSPAVGMSPSAVSHQLSVLRRMNLVRFRREGQRAFYALDDEHIEDLLRVARRHAMHGK
jgi:ArsR family transcriptional regulator, lead/cadmium/zinc/bismuth-responsive transcriptional repressor